MLSMDAKIREVHYRRIQDVKKYNRKVYVSDERKKLRQIEFEEYINRKKVQALKEYLDLLEIKKITLRDIERQREMQEYASRLLNII